MITKKETESCLRTVITMLTEQIVSMKVEKGFETELLMTKKHREQTENLLADILREYPDDEDYEEKQ
jgi:hypothetical protein